MPGQTTGYRLAAEQGHTTIVVTCTNGDLGEVKIPGLWLNPRQAPADRQRLALVRQEELAQAAALLAVTHVYQLGYHDSGMAGWASNQEHQAFVQAPLERCPPESNGPPGELRLVGPTGEPLALAF